MSKTDDPIRPLELPENPPSTAEVEKSRLRRTFERLLKACFVGVTKERRSLEAQLQQRPTFPEQKWQELGYSPEIVLPLLELMRESLDWPNRNFLPQDPVELLFVDDNYGFGSEDFSHDLESIYHVKFSTEEIRQINAERWDLVRLIAAILSKIKQQKS